MNSQHKGLTAALTTTSLATILAGSLLIAHPANGADAPTAAPPLKLVSLSTKLTHRLREQERKAEQRLHARLRQERAARRRRQRAATTASSPAPVQSQVSQPSGTPQQIAATLVAQRGWDSSQFTCLDELWTRESGWNVYADNPSSGAYGIPQALPGSKMASAGADWQTDARTQIEWGLGYIAASYGTPCGALEHSNATGFY